MVLWIIIPKYKNPIKRGYNPKPISQVKQRRKAKATNLDLRCLDMRNPASYMGILLYDSFGATCVHLRLLFRDNHAMVQQVQHNINGVVTTCVIHPGLSDRQFPKLRIVHNITDTFIAT